jgi:hypothetical protein
MWLNCVTKYRIAVCQSFRPCILIAMLPFLNAMTKINCTKKNPQKTTKKTKKQKKNNIILGEKNIFVKT